MFGPNTNGGKAGVSSALSQIFIDSTEAGLAWCIGFQLEPSDIVLARSGLIGCWTIRVRVRE